MGRLFTNLIFFGIIVGLGYYAWITVSPYNLHQVTPNMPMQTVIGGNPWYFPMGYINPRYAGGEYVRQAETEVWLSVENRSFKIIPQDIARQQLGLDKSIDIILTSENNPQTKKALAEFKALQAQAAGFQENGYGLRAGQAGNNTEYLAEDTRISCESELCTLFTTRIPDLCTVIVFNQIYLPQWSAIIEKLTTELKPFRRKPQLHDYFQGLFAGQPTNSQLAPSTPPAPGNTIPEATIPPLGTSN